MTKELKTMRVDINTYETIRRIAEETRRSLTKTLDIIVEEYELLQKETKSD